MPTVAIIQPVNTTEASIFFGASGYASDTEIEWTNANVTVYSDGTFSWLDGETSFTARSYNVTPSGSFTTFTMAIGPLTWPPAHLDYETVVTIASVKYFLTKGKYYTYPNRQYVADFYDYNEVANKYKIDGQQIYINVSGINYPVVRPFTDSFSTQKVFLDLVGPDKKWNSFTAQSPAAPTIANYVALRAAILAGGDFIDNEIFMYPKTGSAGRFIRSSFSRIYRSVYRSITAGKVGGGGFSVGGVYGAFVGFLAVARDAFMFANGYVSKTSIDNEWLFLNKGDTYEFSIDYYIADGLPTSLMDVERVGGTSPGMRVLLDSALVPRVQLKFGDSPNYRQDPPLVSLPTNQWFNLKMQVYLSENPAAGLIRLYLNNSLIIDKVGQTLSTPDEVVMRMEVGITAMDNLVHTGNGLVYADNVNLSLMQPWVDHYRIGSTGNHRISSTGNRRVYIK